GDRGRCQSCFDAVAGSRAARAGMSGRGMAWVLYPLTAAVMIFVLAPLLIVVAMSVSSSAFATFPPRGFTLSWYAGVLADADFRASLGFSALLAAGATL